MINKIKRRRPVLLDISSFLKLWCRWWDSNSTMKFQLAFIYMASEDAVSVSLAFSKNWVNFALFSVFIVADNLM